MVHISLVVMRGFIRENGSWFLFGGVLSSQVIVGDCSLRKVGILLSVSDGGKGA